MTKKYRVKSKFRFTLFLTILMLCVITTSTTLLGFNNAGGTSMNQYTAVRVELGDTIWEIASEYGPDNQDVRKTIHQICELNEIQADDLKAGQHILVPVS